MRSRDRYRECPKCRYVRQPEDFAPEWECPKCGIIYDKFSTSPSALPARESTGPTEQGPYRKGPGIKLAAIVLVAACALAFIAYQKLGNKPEKLPATASDAGISVVIYTTPRCGYCNLAKSFFDKHAIDYFEYDITTSQEGLRQFREFGGRGVPLIFVGNKRINGYNVKALRIALENNGLL